MCSNYLTARRFDLSLPRNFISPWLFRAFDIVVYIVGYDMCICGSPYADSKFINSEIRFLKLLSGTAGFSRSKSIHPSLNNISSYRKSYVKYAFRHNIDHRSHIFTPNRLSRHSISMRITSGGILLGHLFAMLCGWNYCSM